ncbi:MAG TPA: hypothetical protein VEH27_17535 [Methylomirabilota bacterium]|nr:hypothetical protein [Methylomirabilota bacterium]
MQNSFFEAFRKFFSPREEVHKHWYSPVDNFQLGSSEFYGLIERELKTRQLPNLQISRVEFHEGGLLSDKREYLRLKRERLVFDICAAPFGTSYFFSFRFVELPLGVKPLEAFIFFLGLLVAFGLLKQALGTIKGMLTLLLGLAAACYLMRNAVALGLKDLDASLLRTPVIGPIYEALFRKETYYREDTRLMYLSTVNSITEMVVDEVTAAKGIKLVKRYHQKPIAEELHSEKAR